MMSLQLTVDCPYTPHLRRDFLLMLDPAVSSVNGPIVNAERERPAPAATTDERVTAILPHRAERAIRARTAVRHDLAANSYYRVRPGDSLSSIAARIDNRNVGLWAAVNALFRANPAAFVNNDIDQLKAGVTLAIPAVLGASGPVESIATAYEAPGSDIPAQTHASSVQGAALAPVQADVSLDSGSSSGGNSAAPDTAGPATAAPHPATDTNSPFVDAIPGKQFDAGASGTVAAANGKEYANTRPEKRIEPTTAPPVPIVGNQVGADTVSGKGSLNWLLWLGGSGVAIFLGLLLFGRVFRERIGRLSNDLPQQRRGSDHGEVTDNDSDMDLSDTLSQVELVTLDASLDDGSGFSSTMDIDLAQDFGFASSGDYSNDLDLEIDSTPGKDSNQPSTDIIQPIRVDQSIVVEREILPENVDGNYDMSMIVDVTQQTFDESDASTRDLQAVAISSLDVNVDDASADTLMDGTGYDILEQDYEAELTATQALNREISEAARSQSQDLDADIAEVTNELPRAGSDSVTVEMPASASSATDTDITQASMAHDLEGTAEISTEMPTDSRAENDDLADTDVTLEIVADRNDKTVEMETTSRSGRVRKSKAS
jgi:hypothetical protein